MQIYNPNRYVQSIYQVLLLGEIFKVPIKTMHLEGETTYFTDGHEQNGFFKQSLLKQDENAYFALETEIGHVEGFLLGEIGDTYFSLSVAGKGYDTIKGIHTVSFDVDHGAPRQGISCRFQKEGKPICSVEMNKNILFGIHKSYLASKGPYEDLSFWRSPLHEAFFLHRRRGVGYRVDIDTKIHQRRQEEGNQDVLDCKFGSVSYQLLNDKSLAGIGKSENFSVLQLIYQEVLRNDPSYLSFLNTFHEQLEFGSFDLYEQIVSACFMGFSPNETALITGVEGQNDQKTRRLIRRFNMQRR